MSIAPPDPSEFTLPIAIITGGWSKERDRSLLSCADVRDALASLGLQPRVIDLERDRDSLVRRLDGVSVALLAIAGRGAEDGRLQGLLETLGIPYTGSGVLASAVGMNKLAAKTIVAAAGVRVLEGCRIDREAKADTEAARIAQELGLPVIVKPVSEGGSIGLRIAHGRDELVDAILGGAGDELMAEVYQPGRSVSVGVLVDEDTDAVRVLPPLEAETLDGVYSYTAKRNSAQCAYHCPARVGPDALRALQMQAVTAHRALGCHSYSRHDFIVTASSEVLWLEVNTLPGLTRGGNLARMAHTAGIGYEHLIAHILRGARTDRRAHA
ncbi:D-alanine--D-alanine ligase family protein [Streptomyces poonensis]|uniref:D-alanine--D-alanine ligase n=1 Tax=Streptomyces poonensis TaxID=68255 RepID=A0A918UGM7_9ACTN|nr:D-alanine--D-alanine ligase [Streptomyces poonensis]GGZ05805.1 D-alanine--D-alanine ligase [Streptomyces poonensis]GLJ92598.1 D-alanine--D-alanine ligase [Streptomyces poonensis]